MSNFIRLFSLRCISWHGSIRLILFVCKFDHRFLLSDIYFEVVLLLCDSNLYNANKYSWVKVYCARWDYIFDTNWTNNEKSNLIWPKCLSNLSLYCLFFFTFFLRYSLRYAPIVYRLIVAMLKRNFFWWSLLKLKSKFWLNVLHYFPLRSEKITLKCVLHHKCNALQIFFFN